ncbi:hypothetical protein ETI08_13275 [Macrococcoides goetzii]|nr:hypothetical protein [Macrococcus goetzii]TDM39972.1 hypothetical protein ETI08_13275 [Macrococcus goetzii]
MLFTRTPVNKILPILYTTLFVIFVLLIFEQLLQMVIVLLFPGIYNVLPFTLDIFFTEKLSELTNIPSWIIILIIITILIALTFWIVELLVKYNERQEELYIGDITDHHLYLAIFTRPNVNITDLPIYTGDFMRDNQGTLSTSETNSTPGELYRFMHSALFSKPLDEVFYIQHIKVQKETWRGLKFTGEAITNKRNLLVRKQKKFFLSRSVNDYTAMSNFIKSIAEN